MRSRMMAAVSGIVIVLLFPSLPPSQIFFLAPLCLVSALYGPRWLQWAALFTLGMLWACYFGANVLKGVLPHELEGQELLVSGTIVQLPETAMQHDLVQQRFILAVDGAVCTLGSDSACYHHLSFIKLNWLKPEALRSGDYWQLKVRLKRPRGYGNPGSFDYQRWLLQQGIGATGYVREGRISSAAGQEQSRPLRAAIDYQRWRFAAHLDHHVGDLKQLGIIKALLIADRRGISREQWDLFIDTGVIHLVVISGLHIGLVATASFYLLRFVVALCLPMLAAERVAAVLALLAAFTYSLAAGFSLPTQRALIMLTVWLGAVCFARNIRPVSGLLCALLICLVIDPLSPLSQSFWLSFLAVAAIFIGLTGRRSKSRKSRLTMAPQWAVFVGLLPVIAMVQGVINLLSLPANMVLVPLFSLLVVPLSFIAALCVLINASASQPLWLMLDWLLVQAYRYLLQLAGILESFPVPMITPPPLSLLLLAAIAVGVILLPRGTPSKYLAWLLLAPMCIYRPEPPDYAALRVSALDVGQGLSIVVQTNQHVLVYDLGPMPGDTFDTASVVVRPYLLARGIRRVDRLVISHADNDHAGGWQSFRQSMPVAQIIVGEALPGLSMSNSRQAGYCADIPNWQWDGVDFEFIAIARSEPELAGNNRSCVLRISVGDTAFLLTGDIEQHVELQLIRQHPDKLPAAILFAPHHGSHSSSSWPFIKAVRPQHVIFSSGYRNQFGHPATAVVARYRALGSKLHYNNRAGAVVFEASSTQLPSWSHFNAGQSYYWQ